MELQEIMIIRSYVTKEKEISDEKNHRQIFYLLCFYLFTKILNGINYNTKFFIMNSDVPGFASFQGKTKAFKIY